jgi:competence protein ComEA
MQTALTGSVLALVTTVALTADRGAPAAMQASGEGMPDGPGKDVTVRVCGLCHEPRRAASVRLTREGWEGVVDSMVKRGAKGTEQELAIVTDYLATHFLGEAAKPVNVNSAPQIDLELVAGLLRSEARAVVQYREKNGPFMALDDMKQVPGLDFSKIDSKRDFLVAMVLGTTPQ